MTVAPKYSELPWIAHGQPDSYESGPDTLPEAEQAEGSQAELQSNSVTHLKVNAEASREQFSGKQLIGVSRDRVDFSDRISASRRTGYIAFDSAEYASGPPEGQEKESAMQRFQRLQCDIAGLVAEVEAARAAVEATTERPESRAAVEPAQITAAAADVAKRLSDAHLHRQLGSQLREVEARQHATHAEHGRLMQQLLAQRTQKSNKGGHMVYEMYSTVDKVKNMEQAKFTELEQRLQRLESLVGPSPPLPRFSLDSGPNGARPLVEAASRLNSRASALCEGSFLEQMEGRLGAVHAKLGQVTQKKEAVTAADTENKVAELYEIVKRWASLSPTLPHVVTRLEAVKALHEQAMQFSQAATFIASNQDEAQKLLKQHQPMVGKLETALSNELAKVHEACDHLGARVKAAK